MEHHSRGLRQLLQNEKRQSRDRIDQLVQSLTTSPREADLSPADQAMIGYAMKLTATPADISPSDVANLRDHGFDDLAIHDLACCVSYFAFVNRIADGLGVALESS